MKRLSILLLFASLAMLSCEKDKNGNDSILTGTFKGTFQRVSIGGAGPLSGVTLNFTNNTFSGQSDSTYYPAICTGTFTVNGDKITFQNTCVWPAHFDWTLILNGEYQFMLDGDNLVIRKDYGVICVADEYKLVRQEN